jgi:hypothetical protein
MDQPPPHQPHHQPPHHLPPHQPVPPYQPPPLPAWPSQQPMPPFGPPYYQVQPPQPPRGGIGGRFQRQSQGAKVVYILLATFVVLFCSCSACLVGAARLGVISSTTDSITFDNSGVPASGVTVLTVSGTGDETTKVFHVNGDWTVKWTCNNSGVGDWPFAIFIYPTDENALSFDTLAGSCASGKHTDQAEEHQTGDFYLKIAGDIPWSITIIDQPD